ncbi:hypothetical protein, partial [Streptomyces griseus]|uniref:hypothetical protein n=1 Tax=Streptomyces griseus TaxID=1911 RepID=UPI00345386C4
GRAVFGPGRRHLDAELREQVLAVEQLDGRDVMSTPFTVTPEGGSIRLRSSPQAYSSVASA